MHVNRVVCAWQGAWERSGWRAATSGRGTQGRGHEWRGLRVATALWWREAAGAGTSPWGRRHPLPSCSWKSEALRCRLRCTSQQNTVFIR